MPQWSARTASESYRHLYKLKPWVEGRKRFLAANPWCIWCARFGVQTAATRVNHRIPHRGHRRLFLDKSNWEPVCERCHNSACKQQDRGRPVKGCDLDGLPIDPNHPWNRR